MTDAKVILWGNEVGAVSWLKDAGIAAFQYDPDFLESGMQLSPLKMPLSEQVYQFPELSKITFKGLPGMLADSLPDKFGNAIIDSWLASQSRTAESFNPVERLCYIGNRGMGSLEFKPALRGIPTNQNIIDVAKLVELTNAILNKRQSLSIFLQGDDDRKALEDILKVGTSAGGARAKAILAWNPKTNHFRSGQIPARQGYEYWMLKFDGINNNKDKEIADPQGFGKIEYAYYLLAKMAGIDMMPCRLFHEGGRSHFMTKRFDRTDKGAKLHMQSLCGIAHYDFNQPRGYSYEQALQAMKRLNLSNDELQQQVLRAIFNVVGRNNDDHVKNIAYLMTQDGNWHLSPAFDVSYAYNPNGAWTGQHQMSINGKFDDFVRDDFYKLGSLAGLKPKPIDNKINMVCEVFKSFHDIAGNEANIDEKTISKIESTFYKL